MWMCPTCRGSGLKPKVKRKPKDNDDYDSMTMEDCPTCNGQGEVPYPPS